MIRTAAILALLLAALPGCATFTRITAADGGPAWRIRCGQDSGVCSAKAEELCPAGYVILDRDAQQGAVANSYASGNQYAAQSTTVVTPTYRGILTVRCRDEMAAPALQAAPAPPTTIQHGAPELARCAFPNGTYLIQYGLRDGTCGKLQESLMTFAPGDKWGLPPHCHGDSRVSPDGCEVSFDYRCESEGLPPGHVVQVTHWNRDGTQASGVRQVTFTFPGNAGGCTGTYDITFKRL